MVHLLAIAVLQRSFVGGAILPGVITGNDYPALSCIPPITNPYPHSMCRYGDMTDLINDPIYTFIQSSCIISTPTITSGGPTTFCTGGSVTLTSSAGSSYLWSNGETTPGLNVTEAGSYTVRVTDASGCQSAASVATVVTVNALPVTPAIIADGPTTFCAGGSVTLSSSPGSTYLWSTGATTKSINVTTAGNYTVRVANASGCISAPSVNTIVTVNALPEATANNNGPVCAGSGLNLAGGPDYMFFYSWTGPIGFKSTLQNPSIAANAAITMAGVYSLIVTNADGCSDTAATTAVINTLPAVNAKPV